MKVNTNVLIAAGVLMISCVVFGAMPSDQQVTQYIEDCQKNTSATAADLEVLGSFDVPKTKTQSCLLACFYKKLGMYNDKNVVNMTMVTEYFLTPDSTESKSDSDSEEMEPEMIAKLVGLITKCASKLTPSMNNCDGIKTFFECVETSQIALAPSRKKK